MFQTLYIRKLIMTTYTHQQHAEPFLNGTKTTQKMKKEISKHASHMFLNHTNHVFLYHA